MVLASVWMDDRCLKKVLKDRISGNDNDGIGAHDHGAVRENTKNLDRGTLH